MMSFLENIIDLYPDNGGKHPSSGLLRFFYFYSKELLPWIITICVFSAGVSAIEIFMLDFFGHLVDILSVADPKTFVQQYFWQLAEVALLLLFVYPMATLVQELLTNQVIFGNYPTIVRWRSHCIMLSRDLMFFQSEQPGQVAQKVLQTATALRDGVVRVVDFFTYTVVFIFGSAYLIVQTDGKMLIPLFIWLVSVFLQTYLIIPAMSKVASHQANARAIMTSQIVDVYTNIHLVKLFSRTNSEYSYARNVMNSYMGTVYPMMRLITILNTTQRISNSVLLAIVGGMSIYLWQIQAIGLGAIAVNIALVLRLRSMSEVLVVETSRVIENIGTVQNGRDMLTEAPSQIENSIRDDIVVKGGEIRFEAVSFGYNSGSRIINDLSFCIKGGEKVGIVGRSGAGKSTTVSLLLRLFDPDCGRIFIDGQDISEISIESLRHSISYVAQDAAIFNRSVQDNIRYGQPDATNCSVVHSAVCANADDFIKTLCDSEGRKGYDAHVGEHGASLSGGQRQRIALARGILKDSPIIVFDEATSALDSEVENGIWNNVGFSASSKTIIVIAHRLSTVASLDRILVIDQGRVVESGKHEELLAADGLYSQLWRFQFSDVNRTQAAIS